MKVLIVCLLYLVLVSNSFAAIYQTVDEDGNIIFTDRPEVGTVQKKIDQPSVFKIKKNKNVEVEKKPVEGLGKLKEEKKKAKPYTKFTIVAPEHDKSMRNNIGNVELKLQITPQLQTKFGHHIKVEFDGKVHKSQWKSASILFANIDRGSHTFKAFIVDEAGKRIKTSQTVTFHLHRFSRLFK